MEHGFYGFGGFSRMGKPSTNKYTNKRILRGTGGGLGEGEKPGTRREGVRDDEGLEPQMTQMDADKVKVKGEQDGEDIQDV